MRKNLIEARKKAQLTQTELAKQLSVSLRQYQSLEAGTSGGSIKVWQRLKELYEKPIDFLLEQEPIGGAGTPPIRK